jgi:hypothetical protein
MWYFGQCTVPRRVAEKGLVYIYIVCCISVVSWLWVDSKGSSKQDGRRIPGGFREGVILRLAKQAACMNLM